MYKDHYRTIEWQAKRNAILNRDNFTCKSCGVFDPSSGTVTIYNPDEKDIELHKYDSSSCEYQLTSQKNGITLKIDFHWGTWLVMPILQVHHKRYIENLKIWEYDNNDLTTLCKACHTNTHKETEIEIFSYQGSFIQKKLFEPLDQSYRPTHNFKPWTFISKDGEQYNISDVNPFVSYFVFGNEIDKINERRLLANNLVGSFFRRFFPDYSNENS